MEYVPFDDLNQIVFNYLKEGSPKYLHYLIEQVEKKLVAAKPDFIVLWDDGLPIGRAIVLVAKKLGITTLVIQYAIYYSFAPSDLVADYALVWGKYFKDIFLKHKAREPEDMYILGYPYLVKKSRVRSNGKKKITVCYLGQNYEALNTGFLEIKIKTLNGLSLICKELGMEFIYRPHPADDRLMLLEKLPYISFTPEKEKLEQTFEKADIFISLSSASLVEAALRSKISLQLVNYPLTLDNFEKLGVCNKSFKNIKELEVYLTNMVSMLRKNEVELKFNNDYIETRNNPADRFLEILSQIEKSEL